MGTTSGFPGPVKEADTNLGIFCDLFYPPWGTWKGTFLRLSWAGQEGGSIQPSSLRPMSCPVLPLADVEVGTAGCKDKNGPVVVRALLSTFLEEPALPLEAPWARAASVLTETSPQT